MRFTLALALLALSCAHPSGTAGTAGITTPVDVLPLSVPDTQRAAGDQALLTLAINPSRFDEARDSFVAALGNSLVSAQLGQVSFSDFARMFDRRFAELPAGLDLGRPIFVRLGEAPDDLAWAVRVALGQSHFPLRHVLAFPAESQSTLRRSLSERFSDCEATSETDYECPSLGLVRVIEEHDWVFVVLREGIGNHMVAGPGEPPVANTVAAEEGLFASSSHPLLDWALNPPFAAAVLLRPEHLRGTVAFFSALMIRQALSAAAAEYRVELFSAGLSELLAGYLRTSAYDLELGVTALAIETQPFALHIAAQLTPQGEARWSSTSQEPVGTPAAQQPVAPFVTIHSNLVASELASAAPASTAPFGFMGLGGGAVESALEECGVFCGVRMLFQPLGFAALAERTGAHSQLRELVSYQHRELPTPGLNMRIHFGNARGNPLRSMGLPDAYLSIRARGALLSGTFAFAENTTERPIRGTLGHTDQPVVSADALRALEVATGLIVSVLSARGQGTSEGPPLVSRLEPYVARIDDPALAGEARALREVAALVDALLSDGLTPPLTP